MHKKLVIIPILVLMFILFIGAENPYINNLELKANDIADRISTSVQGGLKNGKETQLKKIPGVTNVKTITNKDTLYIAIMIDKKWNDRNSIRENIKLKLENIDNKIKTAYLFMDPESYNMIEEMKKNKKGYTNKLNELVIAKDHEIIKIR